MRKLSKIAGSGNLSIIHGPTSDCELNRLRKAFASFFLSTHNSSLAEKNFLLKALKFNIQTRERERIFWKNTKFLGVEIVGGQVALNLKFWKIEFELKFMQNFFAF